MSSLSHLFSRTHSRLLSESVKQKSERIIISLAISSFGLHLILIFIAQFHLLGLSPESKLLSNPIVAIYTPFSFILIYEVYLLVFYLPKSITTYIGKQYEIITLIVIRRIFKDLANLELTSDWFSDKYDLQFTYDILATVLLFLLIYGFNRFNQRRKTYPEIEQSLPEKIDKFILRKKTIATLLVPIFLVLAFYSFGQWAYEQLSSNDQVGNPLADINEIFFNEFFTILILTDVLLLLLSLYHTDQFHKVIRNSGFIISTILIRLSFGVEGLLNTVLIVTAVLFGMVMLALHNQFELLETLASNEANPSATTNATTKK